MLKLLFQKVTGLVFRSDLLSFTAINVLFYSTNLCFISSSVQSLHTHIHRLLYPHLFLTLFKILISVTKKRTNKWKKKITAEDRISSDPFPAIPTAPKLFRNQDNNGVYCYLTELAALSDLILYSCSALALRVSSPSTVGLATTTPNGHQA